MNCNPSVSSKWRCVWQALLSDADKAEEEGETIGEMLIKKAEEFAHAMVEQIMTLHRRNSDAQIASDLKSNLQIAAFGNRCDFEFGHLSSQGRRLWYLKTFAKTPIIGDRHDWTTGALYNGNEWKSYVVPRAHPRVPFLMLIFIGLESKRAFRPPGAAWDRFRCTVEPSPGHIRCRDY